MKTISRIAYSNDKKNKTRSILIMMSICLTTMLLVIISTVGNGMIRLQKSQAAGSYGSNYGLFVAADGSQLKEVNRRAEIDATGTMCTEGIIKGNEKGGFVCMDETARKMLPYNKEYELKEGKYPEKMQEIAAGVEKKIKVKKYVPCSECKGTGAENGSAYETCSQCKGSGVITQMRQTILGAMQSTTTCPKCGGEGRIITHKCPKCNGEGIMKEDEVITINIPAGVSEGMQLSMSGAGNAARHGGINGDLLILVQEEPHPELLRDENDLIYNALIDFPTAALGGTLEVPTIDGKAKVKIEPGTQPGKVLRLRGKGLPSVNRYGVGDLLVNLSVYVPESLTAEERKKIEELRTPGFTPSKSVKDRIFSKLRHMFE